MKKIKDYKPTIELIKHYRWDSLIFKFAKDIAIYVFIPFIIICALVCFFYVSEYNRKDMEEFLSVSAYINSDVSNVFENINENVNFLSNNRIVNDYLNIDKLEEYNHQNYRNYIETLEVVRAFAVGSEYIEDICLYSYASNETISIQSNGTICDYKNTVWYDYMEKNNTTNFSVGEKNKIYVVKNINFKSGIVVFVINCKSFLKNYNNYGMVLKNKDETIFSKIGNCIDFSDSDGVVRKDGYIYSSKNYGDIKTVVCKVIKNTHLVKNITLLIFICMLIVCIFAVIVLVILSFAFYKNIEEVIEVIHNNDFDRKHEKTDEISYIIRSIRRISDENHNLTNTMVKNFLEIKKLNSVVLQNQISPHFLMNTLNTVNLIIFSITKKKNGATEAVRLLSEFFGDILNTNVYTFTIEQEISYCDKYLKIEKILDNRFDVVYNIDDEVKKVNIPKLLIQPIVENSVKHGIKYLDENIHGEIYIEAKKSDEHIFITVTDNGPENKKHLLEELNEKLQNGSNEDKNYKDGLFNVNRRIKLLYGENYGVTIQRKEEKTVVELSMPLN